MKIQFTYREMEKIKEGFEISNPWGILAMMDILEKKGILITTEQLVGGTYNTETGVFENFDREN